jgi:hypothetical protein
MRIPGLTIALTFWLTSGMSAQPLPDKFPDRHPAYANDPVEEPKLVRTIRIQPVHTFEQRWEPVRELLGDQQARQALAEQNAPAAGSVAPMPVPRAKVPPVRATPAVWRSTDKDWHPKEKDTCLKHGLKTIWNGLNWRCRRG